MRCSPDLVWFHLFFCRHFKWRHAIGALALDPENLAARRQYSGTRAQAHEHFGQTRRCVDDVLGGRSTIRSNISGAAVAPTVGRIAAQQPGDGEWRGTIPAKCNLVHID